MKPLPGGYQIVGALCIAHAAYMFFLTVGVYKMHTSTHKAEWLLTLSPIGTLLGGLLLLRSRTTLQWTASGVLILSGILLIWQAVHFMNAMIDTMNRDQTAVLGVLLLFPVMVLPAAIVGPTALATGALLCCRLARSV